MVNKKKRLFKLLFFPISLLLCLSIFLINSFAQNGYEIQSNGDIKSLNLIQNGANVSGSNTALYFNCSLTANKTYTFKLYGGSNSGAFSLWSADSNDNFIEEFTSSTGVNSSITFTTSSNCSKIGIYPNNINNANLMLNEGSSSFDYFPYGYYYANGVYNNVSIYNLFNNGFAELLLANNQESGFFEFDWFTLSANQTSITLNDMPNIRDYLYANTQNSNDEWIIKIFMPNNISTYANMRVNYNPRSYNSNFYINLDSLDNNSSVSYFASDNMNIVSLYSNNFEYDSISIHGYYKYYIDAFEIYLNTLDSGLYNQGYTDGFNNGSKNGENLGYNQGYQVGYNEGINSDLETNGIRTLFNSILSFPVDMIKNVFNFEFMGVNIASVITFIISIGIVAFVLKKFL